MDMSFIPEEVMGVPIYPLIGLIIGILFAVNEAVKTKFKKSALKVNVNGEELIFDNRYLVTAFIGIAVVVLTVVSVKEAGILRTIGNDASGLFTALMAGFTEGWAVIRVLNTRLDLYLMKVAEKAGADSNTQSQVADAVEFVEVVDKPKVDVKAVEEPKKESVGVSFEEL